MFFTRNFTTGLSIVFHLLHERVDTLGLTSVICLMKHRQRDPMASRSLSQAIADRASMKFNLTWVSEFYPISLCLSKSPINRNCTEWHIWRYWFRTKYVVSCAGNIDCIWYGVRIRVVNSTRSVLPSSRRFVSLDYFVSHAVFPTRIFVVNRYSVPVGNPTRVRAWAPANRCIYFFNIRAEQFGVGHHQHEDDT